jgi:hypothetical protein
MAIAFVFDNFAAKILYKSLSTKTKIKFKGSKNDDFRR